MRLAGSFGSYNFGPGSGNAAVSAIKGMEGPAPQRDTNQDLGGGGQLKGKDLRNARQVTATFVIIGIDADDFDTKRLAFLAAFSESDDELPFVADDGDRMVWASVTSVDMSVDTDRVQRTATVDVVLTATDPTIYGPEQVVTLTQNVTATLTLGGRTPTSGWLLEVAGSVVGPKFTAENENGGLLTADLAGQTIASGDTLQIDGRLDEVRVHKADGTYVWLDARGASGYGSVLWPILHGTPDVKFTRTSGTSTATLTIRPAL